MARVTAILCLLLAIGLLVGCGIAVSKDYIDIAGACGLVGFIFLITSLVLFFKKKRKTKTKKNAKKAPPVATAK